MSDKHPSGRIQLLIAVCLVLGVLVAFWPALQNGFVFDDKPYVVENQHVQTGFSTSAMKWALTAVQCANWHPLTWLSHMLDCRLYDLNPLGHHLTNLLFHMANALLLLFVLKRMTGSFWRSSFVAALFAIHPVHVESVAWVAERKDVLSTFLWLLTIWVYLGYAGRPDLRRYVLVVIVFALGLMAKPMLVSLPIVMLLLDYWPLRRLSLERAKDRPWAGWKLLWEKVPLLALSAGSCVVTYLAQRTGGAVIEIARFPLGMRIENALVAYAKYIGKMFWPGGLAAYYPYPLHGLPVWQIAGASLLLVAVSVLVIKRARVQPYLGVGWLWYLITLVPVIGLVQVGEQSMADRYTYVPLIGLFVMIAWGVPELLGRLVPASAERSFSPHLPVLAVIVIPALMVSTSLQVRYWKSDLTLFQRAVRVTSENKMAHNNLGLALAEQGELDQAVHHCEEALAIDPNYVDAHINLAHVLIQQGKTDEALAHYEEALEINPDAQKAATGLANVLAEQGDMDSAIAQYSKVLEADPNNADAHYNLALAVFKQGRISDAVSHFARALEINPRYAKAHNNLGMIRAGQGELEEAIAHYSAALRIKSDYAQAHHNLAMVLVGQGKLDEAIDHFLAAVQAEPDYAEAHNNLGIALALAGRLDEAVSHFAKSVQLEPDYADAHFNYALALSGQGKSDEAIAHYSQGLRIKPDNANARMGLAVELYGKGRYAEAWREVHLGRKYGATPHPGFLAALGAKMPDPGP